MDEPLPAPSTDLVRLAPGVAVPLGVLAFTFARGGGPGGQNVNKLATRATLTVRVADLATVMPGDALARLRRLAGRRWADDPPRIVISAAETRSQLANRRAAVVRLADLVARAMVRPRRRVKTKPSKAAKRKRVEEKKQRGQTKADRRPPRDRE